MRKRMEPTDPKYLAAKRLYQRGGIGVPALARELQIPQGTVASWKRRYGWTVDADADAVDAVDAGGGRSQDLTPRRARLAQVLPFSRTKTEAGEKAGFSRKNARNAVREAMQNPAFLKALHDAQETQAEMMDRLGATPERIIVDLLTIESRCLNGVELRDKKGNVITMPIKVPAEGGEMEIEARLYTFDPRNAAAALKELAELRGMMQRAKENPDKLPDFVPLDEICD